MSARLGGGRVFKVLVLGIILSWGLLVGHLRYLEGP